GQWAAGDRPRYERDRGDPPAVAGGSSRRLAHFAHGGVAITSVTLAELLAGVRRLSDGRRKDSSARRIWIRTRGSRSVLPLDDLAADHCADVLVAREPAGAPISADQHGRRTD